MGYPMGLAEKVIQWVYQVVLQRKLSNGFIQWVYPMGFIQVSCRENYPMGLSNGSCREKLCCPASLCPRHPNSSHTVNPDF